MKRVVLLAALSVLAWPRSGSALTTRTVEPLGPRFVANGDGTVTDAALGVQWELKTTHQSQFSPHKRDVDLVWTRPEATNSFIGSLSNCDGLLGAFYPDFAGRCHWRLPSVAELRTILMLPCAQQPCIASQLFAPTANGAYWSSTDDPSLDEHALAVDFSNGSTISANVNSFLFVRAVSDLCPVEHRWTFEAILCRLEALANRVAHLVPDERLRRTLLRSQGRAVKNVERARAAFALGYSAETRDSLALSIRTLIHFGYRSASLVARQKLDDDVNAALREATNDLLRDLRELRQRQYWRTDVTQGAVHYEHLEDVSRCVDGVERQFGDAPRLSVHHVSKSLRMPEPQDGIYGTGNHNQGMAWFPDAIVDGQRYARVALTHTSDDETGLMTVARPVASGVEGFFSDPDRVVFDREKVITKIERVGAFGNHDHPGGAQATGNLLAIAMEEPRGDENGGRAAAYLFRMSGFTPEYLQTVFLGGGPDDDHVSVGRAAAMGITQLASGRFLLAIGGATDGTKSIWFYVSSDQRIGPTTEWRLADVWVPSRMPGGICDYYDGKIGPDCFVGGGGALSLITDCTGQIYVVALQATSERPGKDDEYIQVLRLTQDDAGRVILVSVVEQRRELGRNALDDYTFRWGSGVAVTENGRLAIFATERRARQDANFRVDGWLRVAFESGFPPEPPAGEGERDPDPHCCEGADVCGVVADCESLGGALKAGVCSENGSCRGTSELGDCCELQTGCGAGQRAIDGCKGVGGRLVENARCLADGFCHPQE